MRLFGRNPVIERLRFNAKSISKIYLNEKTNPESILTLARDKKVSCVVLKNKEFLKLSPHPQAQGVIAEVEEFTYTDYQTLLELPDKEKYTFIALSNITDPQNLGSILRTAACFGRFSVVIPRHRSVQVNETVLKIACGGENFVPVVQVTNLIPFLADIKKHGYWVAGGVVDGGEEPAKVSLNFPLCLIIGAEDKGIRPGLISHLDFKLSLPMPNAKLSLNAAVATTIFCYEIMRQKSLAKS